MRRSRDSPAERDSKQTWLREMTIADKASGSVRSTRSAMLPDPVWKNEQLTVVADVEFFVAIDLAEIHGHVVNQAFSSRRGQTDD